MQESTEGVGGGGRGDRAVSITVPATGHQILTPRTRHKLNFVESQYSCPVHTCSTPDDPDPLLAINFFIHGRNAGSQCRQVQKRDIMNVAICHLSSSSCSPAGAKRILLIKALGMSQATPAFRGH
ncbi:hypothetical protein J6590_009859 [Homalodisca vitripennis]|nr:hypothetical protein J6590_009859 [Homalodisca vitripennis]